MRKALITGGAGFIGSHLAQRLLNEGWQVTIIDNLSTGARENIPDHAKLVLLDLSKDDFVSEIPSDHFEAIFHLAAQSSGEISFDDPEYDLRTNCLSTLKLLEWAFKTGIKRFIYASSMSVYGEQRVQPVGECFAPLPKSFYGVGKLASEGYLNVYSSLGVNATALRLFNVYGPGQNMQNLRQGMISIYMAYILKGEKLLVKGSLDRFRDFIYIDDVIDAFMQCLDCSASFGKIYNVGTGLKVSVRQVIEAELKAFGHDPKQYPITCIDSTPGDTFGIYADVSRIQNDVGWSSKVTLNDGLRKMVQWLRKD